MNTIGTKQMLDLAEKLPQLKAFIHCSTAFSNTNQDPIKEIVYEPVIDVNEVMEGKFIYWESLNFLI